MRNSEGFLLDNDTLNHIFYGQPAAVAKLEAYRQVTWLSSVAVSESLRGLLRAIGETETKGFRPNSTMNGEIAHTNLTLRIYGFSQFQLLPFDEKSELLFNSLPHGVRKIGPNDCRIAAMAITYGLTVVTCNTRDFQSIAEKANWENLRFADWTK